MPVNKGADAVLVRFRLARMRDRVCPAGRCDRLCKAERVREKDLFAVHCAVVCLDDVRAGLEREDHCANTLFLLRRNKIDLVEYDGIAEFDLLHKQVFDVVLIDAGAGQRVAVVKFVCHALCIDDCGNAVEIA